MFSKEIFIVNPKTYKTTVLQYHSRRMFERMLKKIQKWERQGKDIHILDVRNSVY